MFVICVLFFLKHLPPHSPDLRHNLQSIVKMTWNINTESLHTKLYTYSNWNTGDQHKYINSTWPDTVEQITFETTSANLVDHFSRLVAGGRRKPERARNPNWEVCRLDVGHLDHRENCGTLGMVPLLINPIYTLCSGFLLEYPDKTMDISSQDTGNCGHTRHWWEMSPSGEIYVLFFFTTCVGGISVRCMIARNTIFIASSSLLSFFRHHQTFFLDPPVRSTIFCSEYNNAWKPAGDFKDLVSFVEYFNSQSP